MKKDKYEYVPEYVKRARQAHYEHDIEEILIRLKNLEENQEQITEILWDELKRKVW